MVVGVAVLVNKLVGLGTIRVFVGLGVRMLAGDVPIIVGIGEGVDPSVGERLVAHPTLINKSTDNPKSFFSIESRLKFRGCPTIGFYRK